MIAANRAARRVHIPWRSSRGVSPLPRRRPAGHTYGLVEYAGGALTAYGALGNGNQSFKGGNSVIGKVRSMEFSQIPAAIKSTAHEAMRSGTLTQGQIGGGAVVWAAGRVANKVGVIRKITHRLLSFKLDRKTRVAFT